MENSPVKMSARRSLASFLGEPDHEQNKRDLERWSKFFDDQFKAKWGVDPRADTISTDMWTKVDSENEDSVPSAYEMPSLTWACNPKERQQKCFGQNHLGLSVRTSSPSKPLGEVNSNTPPHNTPSSSPVPTRTELRDYEFCPVDLPRPSTPVDSNKTPESESSTVLSSCPSATTSSRKRKASTSPVQTHMGDYFVQKKKACVSAKRRIHLD